MRARVALGAFVLLAIFHTWPLSTSPASLSLNHNADAQQWEWTLSWIAHTIVRAPLHLFDGNVFAPEPRVLTYSDPVIVPGILGAPIRWLGGSPVLTFNLVMIAGLALTAWAGWFVAWKWTGSASAALVGGALVAFNAHLLTRLPHVQASHSWGLPLTLYFADRLAEEPRRRDVIGLALVLAATSATSLYTLTFALLIVACVMLTSLFRWRSLATIAGSSVLGMIVGLPVLWPYIQFARTGVTRPIEMVTQFSAVPAAYLTSLSRLEKGWTAGFFHGDINVLFPGVLALVLASIGALASARIDSAHRRRLLALGLIAGFGILLSFGPSTSIYHVLYAWVPLIRGLRAAVRFGFLALIVIGLIAAMGVAWLQQRTRSRAAAFAVAAILLAGVTAEAWLGPVTVEPFNGVPPIYRYVAEAPAPVLLVEVPFWPAEGIFQNGEYMLNATAHWQPVANGYSGYTPQSYRDRADLFWFFPEDWAIQAIKKDAVTHVMVHLERFEPHERPGVLAALRDRTDLQLVAAEGEEHRLYRVVR